MKNFAILGGGPAGTAAALAARRLGMSVAIWDRDQFPRDKVCGESLSALGIEVLERLNLSAGDDVFIVETQDGVLITPYDPDFAGAMRAYRRVAARYRNALRELSR